MSERPGPPPGVDARGFVAKNGRGEWCWFADRGTDGLPLPPEIVAAVEAAQPYSAIPRPV